MRKSLVLAALAGVLSLPAFAQDKPPFIAEAIQGNLAEVRLGQLAAQNGESDKVKQFGQMLVKDHEAANDKAIEAAKAANVMVPDQPSEEGKSAYDELASKKGAEFDKAFIEHAVEDHKKDVDMYSKAAEDEKGAVADYAKSTLPTLKKHLERAQSLTVAQQ